MFNPPPPQKKKAILELLTILAISECPDGVSNVPTGTYRTLAVKGASPKSGSETLKTHQDHAFLYASPVGVVEDRSVLISHIILLLRVLMDPLDDI